MYFPKDAHTMSSSIHSAKIDENADQKKKLCQINFEKQTNFQTQNGEPIFR